MRWTRCAALVSAIAALSGCAYGGYQLRGTVASYAEDSGRPERSYYCYDCHGYRYFDPYYDWCPSKGFRYSWDRHPETVAIYRERYVRIKASNPGYGRFRYGPDYRERRKYREPVDYERWKNTGEREGGKAHRSRGPREKYHGDQGKKEMQPPGDRRDI